MKTIILVLSIFIGSLIAEPITTMAAAGTSTTETSSALLRNPFVNQKSAKRFKTNKRHRRGRRTCLKKGGCKTKGFHRKRGKCAATSDLFM